MRSWLPPAVLLLAAFAAPASVHAQLPATAAIEAYDYGFRDPASPGQSAVAVAVGGTVAFSYPSGCSAHNVVFPAAAPTTCTQTAGPVGGPVPPLPENPTGSGWAGSCRFDTAGTFTFVCGLNDSMGGKVVVGSSLPGPGPSPGNPPGGPPPGSPGSPGSPGAPGSPGGG